MNETSPLRSRALQETSLRHVFEVARTGSVQAASQRLHVAGSAISRQIADLESECRSAASPGKVSTCCIARLHR